MDEMNKMDAVVDVVDTVSDVANYSSTSNVGYYVKGGLIGAGVTAASVAAYKFLIKPLWQKAKAKAKAKLAKAKRGNIGNDIPKDIDEEYPIK